MNNDDVNDRIQRILVPLDTSSTSTVLIAQATRLASQLQAELLGIFIEDINLLRLATLPFAREFAYDSVAGRKLDTQMMERSLRAQSERIRKALEQAAASTKIRPSFQVIRGNVVTELLAVVTDKDLLILGKSLQEKEFAGSIGSRTRAVIAQANCNIFIAPQEIIADHPFTVFFDGSAASQHALAMAMRFINSDKDHLLVILPAGADTAVQNLQTQAQEILAGRGIPAQFLTLADNTARHLASVLNRQNSQLLIIDARCSLWNDEERAEILARINCPVMLVR